jgi:PAS domain S-box-containing protein
MADEKLRKSELMLQSVLDHFPGVVFWKDRESVYLGCNQNFAMGAGLNNSNEIVGKSDFELPWGKTEAKKYRADDLDVMENCRQNFNIHETQLQSDGRVLWFDTSKLPFLNSKGQIIGLIGISNDITKLKTVESELIFENIEKGKRAEELVIANEELLFQIVEKQKVAEELIAAKYKAEESNRLKTAFLNNISHEIRTPFNVMLGFLKLILEEELATDERVLFGQMINQSASRLMNTIDNIIEISKLQSGSLEIFATEFNIKLLTIEIFNSFKSDCEVKYLEIEVTHDLVNSRVHIIADRQKLSTILSNLIENAIKYTKRGSIQFGYAFKFKPASKSCKTEDSITPKEIEFYVRDTGIGIPKSKQTKIFERFMQADVSTTREFEGTGLGLAITKAYVEGLGGRLWVESEEGKGSTFYFTLPIVCEKEK